MLTSAKLPSIAFFRNVSLCLSFADALAIEIAIKVAVPSDTSSLFIGKLLRVLCREHANSGRGSNSAHGATFPLALRRRYEGPSEQWLKSWRCGPSTGAGLLGAPALRTHPVAPRSGLQTRL